VCLPKKRKKTASARNNERFEKEAMLHILQDNANLRERARFLEMENDRLHSELKRQKTGSGELGSQGVESVEAEGQTVTVPLSVPMPMPTPIGVGGVATATLPTIPVNLPFTLPNSMQQMYSNCVANASPGVPPNGYPSAPVPGVCKTWCE